MIQLKSVIYIIDHIYFNYFNFIYIKEKSGG